MSDVTRYTAVGDGVVKTDPAGPLIEYTDYATLKAENEELHKDYEALAHEHTKLIERLTNCKSEADRLKAEVERLKAELAEEKSANASVEGRLNSASRGLSMRNHLLQAEVERLRASSFVTAVPVEQYERVIKAGDAMAEAMWYGDAERSIWVKKFAETAWNAAKECKQP